MPVSDNVREGHPPLVELAQPHLLPAVVIGLVVVDASPPRQTSGRLVAVTLRPIVSLLIHPVVNFQHHLLLTSVCLIPLPPETLPFIARLPTFYSRINYALYQPTSIDGVLHCDSTDDGAVGCYGVCDACDSAALGRVDGQVLQGRRGQIQTREGCCRVIVYTKYVKLRKIYIIRLGIPYIGRLGFSLVASTLRPYASL